MAVSSNFLAVVIVSVFHINGVLEGRGLRGEHLTAAAAQYRRNVFLCLFTHLMLVDSAGRSNIAQNGQIQRQQRRKILMHAH